MTADAVMPATVADMPQTHPILRFSQVPRVSVHLIANPAERPLGVGEIVQGPVAAASSNGLAAALGVSVRDLPLILLRARSDNLGRVWIAAVGAGGDAF
jgi:hypothetical protein